MDALLVVIALAVGVVVASGIARVAHIPSPLILAAGGVAIASIPGVPALRLQPDLVLFVLLPPLLFAAALQSSLIAIRSSSRAIGQLAIGLVLATVFAVGIVAAGVLPGLGFGAAVALGAVVGAPDAVAATAIARRTGMPRQMTTVLEGESLFNDATALVTLRVAIGAVVVGSVSVWSVVGDFALASLGGAAIGMVAALLFGRLRRRGNPPIVTTSLSIVAPFGVYLAADHAHTSGVIAVVVMGLRLAHSAPTELDPANRLTEQAIWSTIQFLLEGAVFALIGLQLPSIVRQVDASAVTLVVVCVAVLATVLVVRPLWIFGLRYVLRFMPWKERAKPPSAAALAVISWAGMRGVVSLAAAQSLPLSFPRRDVILLVTIVTILGTLMLQGLSLPALIRRLGIRPSDPRQDALQVAEAQEIAARAADERLDQLVADGDHPEAVVRRLRAQNEFRRLAAWEDLGGQDTPTAEFAELRSQMVDAERGEFIRLRDGGQLDEDVLRRLQLRLDLEDSMLETLSSELDPEASGGHQEVLPRGGRGRCPELRAAPTDVPVADPRECPDSDDMCGTTRPV